MNRKPGPHSRGPPGNDLVTADEVLISPELVVADSGLVVVTPNLVVVTIEEAIIEPDIILVR